MMFKIKYLVLIMLLFAMTTFAQTAPCGSVVNSNFDNSTTLPTEWIEYNSNGRVSVDNGRLKLDFNTSKPAVYHDFSPVTNNFSYAFDVESTRNYTTCYMNLVSSTGKYLASFTFGLLNNLSIQYASTMSADVPSGYTGSLISGNFTTNTTYSITANADFDTQTINIYNNGNLMAASVPFLESAVDVSKIDIQLNFMYNNEGRFFFDNISLISPEANRLLLTTNLAEAEALLDSADKGRYDQYPQSAIDAFQLVIDETNSVITDCEATSSSIDNSLSELLEAQNAFIATKTYEDFGAAEHIEIASIATVDFPKAGHTLPLKLTLPTNRSKKMPVHIWVHGGGWSGGTAATSIASNSPHGDYLAENLGIATLGISYRCSGSSGTFSLAMEDVATAYQWALDNADTYNFDMTKVFFSGGSAGTPLAALASQRYAAVIGFIGFNGIYDFVNDAGDFGTSNWYKQNVPSETANSPIFQLRENPPATILMHGNADNTIAYTQSTLFSDKINTSGGKASTIIYPGETHGFFNLGRTAYESVLIEMANFINEILKENDTGLSVDKLNNELELKYYPNPTRKGDALNIKLNSNFNEEKVTVQIVNLLGQIISNSIVYKKLNRLSIKTKDLNSGTYILKVLANTNYKTLKIVIK